MTTFFVPLFGPRHDRSICLIIVFCVHFLFFSFGLVFPFLARTRFVDAGAPSATKNSPTPTRCRITGNYCLIGQKMKRIMTTNFRIWKNISIPETKTGTRKIDRKSMCIPFNLSECISHFASVTTLLVPFCWAPLVAYISR